MGAPVEVKEVDDIAVAKAVEKVARNACKHECHGDLVSDVILQQVSSEYDQADEHDQ